MKLTPGTIYFIGERDHLTSVQSPYFKIGIVRESDGRGALERLTEHQTGNPRTLYVHHEVSTEVVERVETLLHRLFAMNRVSGEWFKFDEPLLVEAIKQASELAEDAALSAPLLKTSTALAKLHSNGNSIDPSDQVMHWFTSLLVAEETIKSLTSADKEIKKVLAEAIKAGESVRGAAK